MEEKDLTEKQRRWLEASSKIGRGPMTKSERETLERLYGDMLPAEQQELERYVKEHFGPKTESDKTGDQAPGAQKTQDPTAIMEQRAWNKPSPALLQLLSKAGKGVKKSNT